jgi:hypothetical protein
LGLSSINLVTEPSEAAVKATDSFWRQQSRSAASDGASNLSAEPSTSYNRRLCAERSPVTSEANNTELEAPKFSVKNEIKTKIK